MGRESFAYLFYTQDAWRDCRKAYADSVGGLCEVCLQEGRISPGEIVHHIIPLTPENISDPAIAYGWSNLRLVCRSCHMKEHGKKVKRWTIDENGRAQAKQ